MSRLFFIILACLLNILPAAAQQEQTILTTPDNWQKEILTFPISFAPGLDYSGIEDLRFTPGWAKKDSDQFWTYTFFWYLDKYAPLTTSEMEQTLETYFDGLMGINLKDNPDSAGLKKTNAKLVKNKKGFDGSINVYDAFFTKDIITLHVKIKETLCTATNKHLVRFRFSPKGFDHPVWDAFNGVKLTVECE